MRSSCSIPKGEVTNWNAGAQRIKGYTPDEIVGEHFSRFYTPEDLDAGVPKRALETARETGRYEAEGWRVRKDGTPLLGKRRHRRDPATTTAS